jgi:hypothetical protein
MTKAPFEPAAGKPEEIFIHAHSPENFFKQRKTSRKTRESNT